LIAGRLACYLCGTMSTRNPLLAAPPHAVEQSLRRLGTDLRTARLRRNWTIEQMAGKIGAGKRAVADAERGKPSASVATYAAILWALDLLRQLDDVATPERDAEGQTLALSSERGRARTKTGLSNDF
jgi:transcriptional regulator with XRE-family HTH domain